MALLGLEVFVINDIGTMNLRIKGDVPVFKLTIRQGATYQVRLLLNFCGLISIFTGMSAPIVKKKKQVH